MDGWMDGAHLALKYDTFGIFQSKWVGIIPAAGHSNIIIIMSVDADIGFWLQALASSVAYKTAKLSNKFRRRGKSLTDTQTRIKREIAIEGHSRSCIWDHWKADEELPIMYIMCALISEISEEIANETG